MSAFSVRTARLAHGLFDAEPQGHSQSVRDLHGVRISGLLLPFISVLMTFKLGARPEVIGMVASLIGVGTTAAYLFAPAIEKSFGIARGIAISMLVAAPLLAITGFSTVLPIVIAAVVLREVISTAVFPLQQRIIMELVTPEERPITAGMEQIFWQLPWAVGAWLGGRIIPIYGYGAAAALSALLMVMASIGYGTMFTRELRERSM